jgi:hypothetical protein
MPSITRVARVSAAFSDAVKNSQNATRCILETCKLTGVDPHAYLAETITKIVNGHPNSRLDELLPWAYPAATPSNTWPENTAYLR